MCPKFSLIGQKCVKIIKMKEFSIKRGSNLEYCQYFEKYQIPYTQNHSSHCTNWYYEVNKWLRQHAFPKFALRGQKCVKIFKMKKFSLKWGQFRILAISWEISNTIYSKSLKSLHQLISWGKRMTEAIDVSKFALRGQKRVNIFTMKGFLIKRGSKIE